MNKSNIIILGGIIMHIEGSILKEISKAIEETVGNVTVLFTEHQGEQIVVVYSDDFRVNYIEIKELIKECICNIARGSNYFKDIDFIGLLKESDEVPWMVSEIPNGNIINYVDLTEKEKEITVDDLQVGMRIHVFNGGWTGKIIRVGGHKALLVEESNDARMLEGPNATTLEGLEFEIIK